MEGGPPMFRQDGSCPALLKDRDPGFPYGAVTRYGPPFQTLPVPKITATGLVRFRSPLLTESRLMSFPPATEMFQFAGFASLTYGFSRDTLSGGLPHSEIPGSTIARISPGLFAACHVLHRLSVPRHPPDALTLRLSATPNGKDHSSIEPIPQVGAAGAAYLPLPANRGQSLGSAAQKTLRRGIATCRPQDTLTGMTAAARGSPATVTQLASSRLSINTCPGAHRRLPKAIRNSSPRSAPVARR